MILALYLAANLCIPGKQRFGLVHLCLLSTMQSLAHAKCSINVFENITGYCFIPLGLIHIYYLIESHKNPMRLKPTEYYYLHCTNNETGGQREVTHLPCSVTTAEPKLRPGPPEPLVLLLNHTDVFLYVATSFMQLCNFQNYF